MSDPMKSAWDEVAESFSALGKAMKERYASGPGASTGTGTTGTETGTTGTETETTGTGTGTSASAASGTGTDTGGAESAERGGDPTAALRDAFDQLLAAGRQFGDRAAGLVRDDEVKAQARHVAATLNSALEATVDQLGQEVRGFFKGRRGDDGSIDTSEHAADSSTGSTGEVQPPPASPEGDTIP